MSASSNTTVSNGSVDSMLTHDRRVSLYEIIIPSMVGLCAIAATANIYILMASRWVKRLVSPTLCFSVSLAAADAYAALVIGVGIVVNSLLPIKGIIKANSCLGLTLEGFRLSGMITSVLHLFGLAVNHYIGILKPLHYASIMTRRNVWIVISVTWVLPMLMNFTFFIAVPEQGYRSAECSNITFILLGSTFRVYIGIVFFFPLAAMIFIYAHIVVIINSPDYALTQYHRSAHYRTRLKAIVTTLLFLGSYVIGWLPAVMFFVLTCDDCILPVKTISPMTTVIVVTIVNSLIVLKSLVDAVLYTLRIKELRDGIHRMHLAVCLCGFAARKKKKMTIKQLSLSVPNGVCLRRQTCVHYKKTTTSGHISSAGAVSRGHVVSHPV